MEVTLHAEPGPFGEVVRMTVNGFRFGAPLTDNSWSETGYRWHDTLHLTYAVCLGWPPVFRALAGVKRRSDPRSTASKAAAGQPSPTKRSPGRCSATPGNAAGTSTATPMQGSCAPCRR